MPERAFYFGFEHGNRKPLKVIPAGIMTDDKYYILLRPSPNVNGAGIYKEVTRNEFIGR